MKKKAVKFFAILLLLLMLVIITSCNKNHKDLLNQKDSQAPEPSIDIVDMSRNSKTETNNMFVFVDNHTYFNQVFWNETKKDNFYKKQIETNDVDIDMVLKDRALESGPLFENYQLAATFTSKSEKPSFILGQIKDENGKIYRWKQPYEWKEKEANEKNALVNLPSFEGKTAKVALRFIWLNDNQKCYGVVDQFIILKKQ